MKKSEFIAALREKTGKTTAEVEMFLHAIGWTIRDALMRGDDVTLPDVVKLSTAKREAREARNPSTGAMIQVPAKTVVKFKVTKDLADAVA